MEQEHIESDNNKKEDFSSINNNEDVVAFIGKLYRNFYNEKILAGTSFSERGFAKKISVSQSLLNNLRNSYKKNIHLEIAIRILKGINKSEYIDPVLDILSPGSREAFFKNTVRSREQTVLLEKEDVGKLVDLLTSKVYGHILSLILTESDKDNTTVEHIKNISPDGDLLLKILVDDGILEITEGNNIVRFTPKTRKVFKNKKIQLDLPNMVKYTEMLCSVINPFLIERDQDVGYNSASTECFHKEDIPEIIDMCQEFRNRFIEIAKRSPGGDIKLALAILAAPLYNPYKYKKNKYKDEQTQKGPIQ